jgi:uncharacterized protein (TIGR04255 family)
MPLDLPQANSEQLAVSHLAVVVCQLRYETNLEISTIETGLAIHHRLGGKSGEYPNFEAQELRSAVINFSPAGVQSWDSIPTRGWRIRSDDGDWAISLMPDHIAIETSAYTQWANDLRGRLALLIDALVEVVKPSAQQRLGLRYVNRLPVPDSGDIRDWRQWIRPELLGPITHGDLAQGVTSLQQQVELDVGGGIGCLLRHGSLKEPDRPVFQGYLLDLDVYAAGAQLFRKDDVLELADRLNGAALAIFQACLTPEYLTELQEGASA